MKTYGGVERDIVSPYLTSAMDGGEWSAYPEEVALLPTVQEADRVPESALTLWRRETSCPCRESNPGRTIRSPTQFRLSYPDFTYPLKLNVTSEMS
jgi:hypothetical protein